MSFELRADRDVGKEVRRVVTRRLTLALEELSHLDQGDPALIEESVHAMRKRCKEVRALARLVRPAIGDDFDEFDRAVRPNAARMHEWRKAVKHLWYDVRLLKNSAPSMLGPRLGATVYAEQPRAFQRRLAAYREIASQRGPEQVTGGLAVVTRPADSDKHPLVAMNARRTRSA